MTLRVGESHGVMSAHKQGWNLLLPMGTFREKLHIKSTTNQTWHFSSTAAFSLEYQVSPVWLLGAPFKCSARLYLNGY